VSTVLLHITSDIAQKIISIFELTPKVYSIGLPLSTDTPLSALYVAHTLLILNKGRCGSMG